MDIYKAIWARIGGRPWTYIIRDTWHEYEWFWIIGLVWCGFLLGHYIGFWEFIKWLGGFTIGYGAGHLFWGTRYIPDQKCDRAEEVK